jgi:structural maintenance of chromosome 2
LGAQLDFRYTAPKGFNPASVKGMVARLVTVNDAKASTALEVTAGGRLFNVVVDTEITGKELLANGKLTRRVTIIPLNKIAQNVMPEAVVLKAKELVGENNVELALNLVDFDEDVQAAMSYVFGTTLVCKDANAAKKVTFDKSVRAKSVTLDGDVFDPVGTVSGTNKGVSGLRGF